MTQSHPSSPRRLALITGASSGIGAAFARHAAAQGFDVALAARRLPRLEALADEIRATCGVDGLPIEADLADPTEPQQVVDGLAAKGRRVDMLINNAGFSIQHGFADTSLGQQKDFLRVTVEAPMALSHLVLPGMLKSGWGRIINVSSITAFSQGGKGHTLYPAGKSFLVKFSQSLNAEVRARGVNVSAICPMFVKTEFQVANDLAAELRATDGPLWQSPEEIVLEGWRRNDRGVEVIVPGLIPKIAAASLKYLPEQIITPLTRKGAAQHYVGDGAANVKNPPANFSET